MPYSSDIFVADILNIVRSLAPLSVCDIGPGAGKYGAAVRGVAADMHFDTMITAVEIDASYVERFGLRDIYDTVIVADAMELIKTPSIRFDLVIIADCIEHVRKSDGIDLINFLLYRSGYIAIIYPHEYVQDDWEGHTHEAHISVWGKADFCDMNCIHAERENMHLFLIKGYQPTRCRIERIGEKLDTDEVTALPAGASADIALSLQFSDDGDLVGDETEARARLVPVLADLLRFRREFALTAPLKQDKFDLTILPTRVADTLLGPAWRAAFAQALTFRGRTREAAAVLRAAARTAPYATGLTAELARLAALHGDRTAAWHWWLASVQDAPFDASPYLNIAQLLFDDGDKAGALCWLDLLDLLDSPVPQVKTQFGKLLWQCHRAMRACEIFEEVFASGWRNPQFLVDYLKLLTGEAHYQRVLDVAAQLGGVEFSLGQRADLNVRTGHAKLALARERITFTAHVAEQESTALWACPDRVLEKILGASRERRPLSLIRLGDGEARFLISNMTMLQQGLRSEEVFAIGDSIWTNWFHESLAASDPADLVRLSQSYQTAIGNADILGVPDVVRLRQDTGHYGYLAAQQSVVEHIARDSPNMILTDAFVNYRLNDLSPYLEALLQGQPFLGVIGPHAQLAELLSRRFEIERFVSHLIPGEERLPPEVKAQMPQRHFPDFADEFLAKLRVPFPGAVFLVAGGLMGKIYCHRIKALGGIALDIGSVADGWMGLNTRPGSMNTAAALG